MSINQPLGPKIFHLDSKLLDASILLERWQKWAKIYAPLAPNSDYIELCDDTEKFFRVDHESKF